MQQCRCPYPHHGPSPMGTSLGGGVVGKWVFMPTETEKATEACSIRELKQCECGCNTYPDRPFTGHSGNSSPPVPVLPLILEYEDDDGPSDDHGFAAH